MEFIDLILALPIILLGAIVGYSSMKKSEEIYWRENPLRPVTKEAEAILKEKRKSSVTRKKTVSSLPKESQELAEALEMEEDEEYKALRPLLEQSESKKSVRTQSSSPKSKATKSPSKRLTG